MTRLSLVCQAAQGRPNREHACTGCACGCHDIPAPADFRALVESMRTAPQENTR